MTNKKEFIKNIFNSIASEEYGSAKTMLSLDTRGNMMVDGFKKIYNYDSSEITIISDNLAVKIYGENLIIAGCDKSNINIHGNITRIDLERGEI